MISYFISQTMDGMRVRVEAKNIDNLRRNIIKNSPSDRDWIVMVFDYYQHFLGFVSFDGVSGHPVFWGGVGKYSVRAVSPKTGKIRKG